MKDKQINHTIALLQNELSFSPKNQEEFYNDILEDFGEDPFFMSQSPTEDFVFMEKTLFSQNWVRVLRELNNHQSKSYKSIKSQIQLFETSEEIAKFAADCINVIQLQLQNNKWNHILNIKTFHLVLNKNFVEEIFQETFSLLDGKLYQWQTEINPNQRRSENSIVRKYQEIVQEDFFAEFADLLRILSEVKLLQILRRSLPDRQKISSTTSYYPLVFKNNKCGQFFRHAIDTYPKTDVTKTLLSKYFEFFKNDDLIFKEVKPKNFFHFVQTELKVNMSRLEPYTSSDKSEKQEYESMKRNFFPE